MSEERKRTISPWVVALLLAVLVGYPLSWGPAAWFLDPGKIPAGMKSMVRAFYLPCRDFYWSGQPEALRHWYQRFILGFYRSADRLTGRQ